MGLFDQIKDALTTDDAGDAEGGQEAAEKKQAEDAQAGRQGSPRAGQLSESRSSSVA
jgi:hypothetical protein